MVEETPGDLVMPGNALTSLSHPALRASGGAWLRYPGGMEAWGNGPIGNSGPMEGKKRYPAGQKPATVKAPMQGGRGVIRGLL
jgi:hypothetical protein